MRKEPLARTRSEKDGRAKDGTEKQNPGGNNQPGRTAARAHTIRGKISASRKVERDLCEDGRSAMWKKRQTRGTEAVRKV